MDVTEEILSFLGLGGARSRALSADPQTVETDGAARLGSTGAFELWLVKNRDAEWIELRDSESVLRATRPKALLLLGLGETLRSWADRGVAPRASTDVRLRVVGRGAKAKLHVSYRTWKPVKIGRRQARAFLTFQTEVRAFTNLGNDPL